MSVLLRLTNMNGSNLGIEEPSRPCTNQSSIHPPQRNGDMLSDRRDSVGDSSTSNFRLVHVGIGVQQNSKNEIQINAY